MMANATPLGTGYETSRPELLAGSGAQALLAVASALVATKLLPPAERGEMVSALAVSGLVSVVVALGSGAALRASLPGARDPALLRASYLALSAILVAVGLILSIAILAGLMLFRPVFDWELPVILASGVWAASQLTVNQLIEYDFAEGRFGAGSRRGTLMAAGALVGLTISACLGRTVEVLMLGMATGAFAVAAISVSRHLVSPEGLVVGSPRASEVRALVFAGLPSLLWVASLAAVLRIDRIILAAVAGPAVVAVYGLAITASEACRLVPTAIAQIATRNAAVAGSLVGVGRFAAVTMLVTGLTGVAVGLGSLAVIPFAFGQAYAQAPRLVFVLVLGEVGYAMFVVVSRALIGIGKTTLLAFATAVFAIASVPLYIWVAERYGALGSAWAGVVIYSSMGILAGALLRSAGTDRRC